MRFFTNERGRSLKKNKIKHTQQQQQQQKAKLSSCSAPPCPAAPSTAQMAEATLMSIVFYWLQTKNRKNPKQNFRLIYS